MSDPFELPELAGLQKGKGVLDVGGAPRVVAELVGRMIAQAQVLAPQSQVQVPVVAAVAPVLVPFERLVRVAEELHFHLLELSRAEGEVARRDLVAEALADLSDSEGDFDADGVDNVFEV